MENTKIYTGSNFLRQRLVLSLLSAKPMIIKNIRDSSDEPGITDYERSLLVLFNTITDGTITKINETGTSIKFNPGSLSGGKLKHDCDIGRAIGYYLEPLLCLAPFCKLPLQITLRGITNNNEDPSVDVIKFSSLPLLKRFIIKDENLEIKIISRGMAPDGGGEVLFSCPVINNVRPVDFVDAGKIKRIRGVAYSCRVSPAMASRMIDVSKGILLQFLPDVYIYADHYKGKHSGKSPGFGISLAAESTTGVFYCAEAVSNPAGDEFIVPEDIAKQASYNLLEEIYRGGSVDSNNQSLACLFMVLGTTDVSKIKTGPLSPYTIQFLRHIEDFFQRQVRLEVDEKSKLKLGTHKITISTVGIGYTNINRKVS